MHLYSFLCKYRIDFGSQDIREVVKSSDHSLLLLLHILLVTRLLLLAIKFGVGVTGGIAFEQVLFPLGVVSKADLGAGHMRFITSNAFILVLVFSFV